MSNVNGDFDPWLGGKEELRYLKELDKFRGTDKVPLIVLSMEKTDRNTWQICGGFSPYVMVTFGKMERNSLTKNNQSIYYGCVRILAHALLCACGGDKKLADRYILEDLKIDPNLQEELLRIQEDKKKEAIELKKTLQKTRELNRQFINKPKVSE